MSGPQAGGIPLPGDGAGARAGADGRARGKGRTEDANADRLLARVVFALLVLGCFVALLVTQRLKHTPPLIHTYKLTHAIVPASAGQSKEERIAVELAKADDVTVTIESSSEEVVATLVRELPVGRYKTLSLRWNGHRGTARGYGVLRRADGYRTLLPRNRGPLAPAGEYTVRVSMRYAGRSVRLPRTFKLVGSSP